MFVSHKFLIATAVLFLLTVPMVLSQGYDDYPDVEDEGDDYGGGGGGYNDYDDYNGGGGGRGGGREANGGGRGGGFDGYGSGGYDDEDGGRQAGGGGRERGGGGRFTGSCPKGCFCESNSDGCKVRAQCDSTTGLREFPTGFDERVDCISLSLPAMGKWSKHQKAEAFRGLPSGLLSLDVSMCNLGDGEGVPDDLFVQQKELRFLSMEFNKLTTLPAKLFSGLSKLKIMYLTGNHYNRGEPEYKERKRAGNLLVELDEDQFADLTSLQVLLMHHNKLVSLPPNIFRNNGKLKVLKLLDNKFQPRLTRKHPAFKPLGEIQQLDLVQDSGDDLEDLWQRRGTTLKD